MSPALRLSEIRMRVVPTADLMNRTAGMHAGARGHAQRRVAIGVGESHAPGGQRVEVRCLDEWMPITAKSRLGVLVGYDDDLVHWRHATLGQFPPGHSASMGFPRGRPDRSQSKWALSAPPVLD